MTAQMAFMRLSVVTTCTIVGLIGSRNVDMGVQMAFVGRSVDMGVQMALDYVMSLWERRWHSWDCPSLPQYGKR